jgi:pseudoazurin
MRIKILAAVGLVLLSAPALAADFEVKMLNKGMDGAMVFEPALTEIAVGDTVTFVATDPGHNAETITDMLPKGAAPFKGAMGKDVSVTFTTAGAYGIKCLPHFAMGMVALVVVGEPGDADLEAAKTAKLPPLARKRMDAAIVELAVE